MYSHCSRIIQIPLIYRRLFYLICRRSPSYPQKIFKLIRRDVATIASEELSTGDYSRQWNAEGLPSGVCFYRLQAGASIKTKKLVILK